MFQYRPDILLLFFWVLMQKIGFWALIPDAARVPAGIYLTESICCLILMCINIYIFSHDSLPEAIKMLYFFPLHSRLGNSLYTGRKKIAFFFSIQLPDDRVEWWGLGSLLGGFLAFINNWHCMFSMASSFLFTPLFFPLLVFWSRCHYQCLIPEDFPNVSWGTGQRERALLLNIHKSTELKPHSFTFSSLQDSHWFCVKF